MTGSEGDSLGQLAKSYLVNPYNHPPCASEKRHNHGRILMNETIVRILLAAAAGLTIGWVCCRYVYRRKNAEAYSNPPSPASYTRLIS